MPRKVYTPADHQRAFDFWYETRNLLQTSNLLGCEYTTIREWRHDTYQCRHHCPWHGWERIAKEREAAANARFTLLEQGNVDPVSHSQAIAAAMGNPDSVDSDTKRILAVDTLVRSDLEVISHYEFLYGKLFLQATGQTIDHGGIRGLPAGGDRQKQLEILYNQGALKPKDLESAIKSMTLIRGFIKEMQADLGIKKHTERNTSVTQVLVENEEEPEKKALTIEELRHFRQLVENTSPDKIEQVKQMMNADDLQVKVVLEPENLPPPPPPLVEAAA